SVSHIHGFCADLCGPRVGRTRTPAQKPRAYIQSMPFRYLNWGAPYSHRNKRPVRKHRLLVGRAPRPQFKRGDAAGAHVAPGGARYVRRENNTMTNGPSRDVSRKQCLRGRI
ncbi:hypothetical protein THAOC_37894, partial [Thalassiosira oceanica]